MTRKIGIIGMGHVGQAVAQQIITNGYADDLVLIDKNEAKVGADALDFEDAMPNLISHTNIIVNDYRALKDADVIISALGKIALTDNPDNDRFAELPHNREQVQAVAEAIKASGFNGILIPITNPVDVITALYQEATGLPKAHVIGTGTLLDSARMKRAVGKGLGVDPRSVSGYNLGEHGNSQFTAWSTVTVLDQPIKKLAQARNLDLDQINEDARMGGRYVMVGKHYTNYGVAAAAVRLANVVLNDAHEVLPVSNYREEYGTYLSYPAVVGRDGILEQLQLELTDEERYKLRRSADFITEKIKESK
ncbi:L-lactate dehydrogenase [Pediococcus pentosaceus]|uniref:L-lactate dehydrogenase n=1 Tax=Pediococcus pentosaceus TaxID=1255 RepID=UPI002FF05AB2